MNESKWEPGLASAAKRAEDARLSVERPQLVSGLRVPFGINGEDGRRL
jgi:hypothetical protein